uniref:Uncharacterized protein n=1 Tax=Caulerpa lentillifera TaxID=148947 RepID=A0A2Z2QKV9_9CHLO|nr:hypothetical protein [Caulerpa lentillifera]AST24231.1 hypothetical protein [Caulerpa lentillifera]QKS32238.1 hypothetical protein [Caulerpa lentillifera]
MVLTILKSELWFSGLSCCLTTAGKTLYIGIILQYSAFRLVGYTIQAKLQYKNFPFYEKQEPSATTVVRKLGVFSPQTVRSASAEYSYGRRASVFFTRAGWFPWSQSISTYVYKALVLIT